MAYTSFDFDVSDHVAHIRLNRPDKRNSMTREFWEEIRHVFAVAIGEEHAQVRAAVISSTGPHFTAGMDLSVFGSIVAEEADPAVVGPEGADALVDRVVGEERVGDPVRRRRLEGVEQERPLVLLPVQLAEQHRDQPAGEEQLAVQAQQSLAHAGGGHALARSQRLDHGAARHVARLVAPNAVRNGRNPRPGPGS